MRNDPKTIALAYIEGCGRQDLDGVAALLAEDLEFVGPSRALRGAGPYLEVLRRLAPIWKASAVRKVFADGNDVCVIYDLVTDTPAGAVPCVEWLRIEGGLVRGVSLYFDRVRFQPASDELARRVSRPTG